MKKFFIFFGIILVSLLFIFSLILDKSTLVTMTVIAGILSLLAIFFLVREFIQLEEQLKIREELYKLFLTDKIVQVKNQYVLKGVTYATIETRFNRIALGNLAGEIKEIEDELRFYKRIKKYFSRLRRR